ncbi:MAG: hypothetical protein ACHQ0J_10530 [Candidatus Dormibacterales bacterium]
MRRRVVVALAVGLLFYALSDILLWQRIFESNGHEFYRFDAQYQTGRQAVLLGMIGLGVVLLWDAGAWALWYAAAFYALAFSGLEDVLYYWLDGRSLPAVLPWLEDNRLVLFHPVTSWSLLASSALWIALWAGSLTVGMKWRDRAPSPAGRRMAGAPSSEGVVDSIAG